MSLVLLCCSLANNGITIAPEEGVVKLLIKVLGVGLVLLGMAGCACTKNPMTALQHICALTKTAAPTPVAMALAKGVGAIEAPMGAYEIDYSNAP